MEDHRLPPRPNDAACVSGDHHHPANFSDLPAPLASVDTFLHSFNTPSTTTPNAPETIGRGRVNVVRGVVRANRQEQNEAAVTAEALESSNSNSLNSKSNTFSSVLSHEATMALREVEQRSVVPSETSPHDPSSPTADPSGVGGGSVVSTCLSSESIVQILPFDDIGGTPQPAHRTATNAQQTRGGQREENTERCDAGESFDVPDSHTDSPPLSQYAMSRLHFFSKSISTTSTTTQERRGGDGASSKASFTLSVGTTSGANALFDLVGNQHQHSLRSYSEALTLSHSAVPQQSSAPTSTSYIFLDGTLAFGHCEQTQQQSQTRQFSVPSSLSSLHQQRTKPSSLSSGRSVGSSLAIANSRSLRKELRRALHSTGTTVTTTTTATITTTTTSSEQTTANDPHQTGAMSFTIGDDSTSFGSPLSLLRRRGGDGGPPTGEHSAAVFH